MLRVSYGIQARYRVGEWRTGVWGGVIYRSSCTRVFLFLFFVLAPLLSGFCESDLFTGIVDGHTQS